MGFKSNTMLHLNILVSVHARTNHTFSFSLSTQEQEQIQANTHEIRVFCSRYSDTDQAQVIEFPEICDIRVNNELVFSAQVHYYNNCCDKLMQDVKK